MSTYGYKLKDPRWQKSRLRVLDRDEWKCRDCGCGDKTLHVHHCFYEKGDPWETSDDFLLTLCEECHKTRGDIEAEGKRALALIFTRMRKEVLPLFVNSLKDSYWQESPPLVLSYDTFKNLKCGAQEKS